MNGLPTLTTTDRAREMTVLKTNGSQILLVGLRADPSLLVGSVVLRNKARYSFPKAKNRDGLFVMSI